MMDKDCGNPNLQRWQGRVDEQLEALRREALLTRAADKEAVEKALHAAEKLAEKHNDLIRQMQERDKNYVAQEVYQTRHVALEDRVQATEDRLSERLARMEVLGSRFVGGLVVLSLFVGTNLAINLLGG
jgi:vacuolar-type H+-ATPase subunit E/Vma4